MNNKTTMHTITRLIAVGAVLIASFHPTEVRGQAKTAESIANAQKEIEKKVAALPAEDQEAIKGLKFQSIELAPMDSRHFTFVKGSIRVTNSGPKNVVRDKLKVESLMLCRDKDKEWVVIHAAFVLDIASKGTKDIHLSSRETNAQFLNACGDRNAAIYDSYTVIRYNDIPIAELHAKPTFAEAKDWWLDDKLIYKKK